MNTSFSDFKSQVVDIREPQDISDKTFFVDTNVWFWLLSTIGYYDGQAYQVEQYPEFINAIRSKNRLCACAVNLVELSHIIEDTCHKIYCRENGQELPKKQYRHTLPDERKKIVDEIKGVWDNMKNFASVLDTEIEAETDIDEILNTITECKVDAYDALMLHNMIKCEIDYIISDDFDFSTIPSVVVFTANRKIVTRARACGKLVV